MKIVPLLGVVASTLLVGCAAHTSAIKLTHAMIACNASLSKLPPPAERSIYENTLRACLARHGLQEKNVTIITRTNTITRLP